MKKRFIYHDEKSNKFWWIDYEGDSLAVNYGKVGSIGKFQTKEFDNEEQCLKEASKLIAAKMKKGYQEDPKFNFMDRYYFDDEEIGLHVKTSHPNFQCHFTEHIKCPGAVAHSLIRNFHIQFTHDTGVAEDRLYRIIIIKDNVTAQRVKLVAEHGEIGNDGLIPPVVGKIDCWDIVKVDKIPLGGMFIVKSRRWMMASAKSSDIPIDIILTDTLSYFLLPMSTARLHIS